MSDIEMLQITLVDKIYTIHEIKKMSYDLFQEYGIEKAYIFGSYARGEATDVSDIDIMIQKGNLKTLYELVELEQKLVILFQKEIDIITEDSYRNSQDSTNQAIYSEIMKDRVLIYG